MIRSLAHRFVRSAQSRFDGAVGTLGDWVRDEDGLEAVEWVLVLGGIIVPMVAALMYVERAVAGYYQVTSWIVSLPFP